MVQLKKAGDFYKIEAKLESDSKIVNLVLQISFLIFVPLEIIFLQI